MKFIQVFIFFEINQINRVQKNTHESSQLLIVKTFIASAGLQFQIESQIQKGYSSLLVFHFQVILITVDQKNDWLQNFISKKVLQEFIKTFNRTCIEFSIGNLIYLVLILFDLNGKISIFLLYVQINQIKKKSFQIFH
ncbi:transmembrane protein, putative (macronuclear) [Tetrahymena thermophila SB210]|uniref:Transmembrane protein, putative n=1 Tax=Tetrahymena thermophila (strain SB210) TaxID=312017 RepID=W7XIP5_TETTS|nr:transmembrane protein, putative [Tetrahymena thermophila SB210]EWS73499.1 transmembrane protein, putative [Tetrahymena thermophila SB210]|eukprot:XP_012653981.1 transmembrane protein, putative [Tetrahymena thermophila SB210]